MNTEERRELRARALALRGPRIYFTTAQRRGFSQAAADEILAYFLETGATAEEFFSPVLADWEYGLLSDQGRDSEGRTGFLVLARARVPLPFFQLAEFEVQQLEDRSRYGYQEIIDLHHSGVPVEFAAAMRDAGCADVPTVIAAHHDRIPLEYAIAAWA